MKYKLLRSDFSADWPPDSQGYVQEQFLKSLGHTDADIQQFIESGYLGQPEPDGNSRNQPKAQPETPAE